MVTALAVAVIGVIAAITLLAAKGHTNYEALTAIGSAAIWGARRLAGAISVIE